jgi:prepilin peptidase CpaA
MPEISVQLILFVICVGAFTVLSAVSDYRTRRIPNKLTVPVFFAGLVYQVAFNGFGRPGLADAGLAFLLGFGMLFVLWLIGGGGGGDVKLMGALSVWIGFKQTLLVLILSTCLVIAGTMYVMVSSAFSRGIRGTQKRYLATGKLESNKTNAKTPAETVEQRKNRRIMAFGVPVALATWAVVLWKLPTFPF